MKLNVILYQVHIRRKRNIMLMCFFAFATFMFIDLHKKKPEIVSAFYWIQWNFFFLSYIHFTKLDYPQLQFVIYQMCFLFRFRGCWVLMLCCLSRNTIFRTRVTSFNFKHYIIKIYKISLLLIIENVDI